MNHAVPSPADEGERLARLRLIRTPQVGPVTFRQLLTAYGTAAAALEVLPDLARRGGRRPPLRMAGEREMEAEMKRTAAAGGRLLFLGEPEYPAALAEIADAPAVITVLGRSDFITEAMVAVVGSRNASTNGRLLARNLARDLAAAGLPVVSGLARGIDAAAHDGALQGAAAVGAGTCAVLAGGADVVFPRENTALYSRVAAEGAVISEMPLGLEPMARHFPRRNRIISGLSLAVVVVEAALRSGSLITARLAGEQGRDVCAVPGSPLDPRARGTNDLLRNGAALVENVDDVLAVIGEARAVPHGLRHIAAAASADTGLAPAADLAPAARDAVAGRLGAAPVSVDALARDCSLPVAAVWTALIELELAGRLERLSGNRVALLPASGAT